MKPVIVSTAIIRPFGAYTADGAQMFPGKSVYATVNDVVSVVTGPLDSTSMLLPTTFDRPTMEAMLDHVDGIFLPGGFSNLHPSLYGEEPNGMSQIFDPAHDQTDMFLARTALAKNIPFLGVCRGHQALNLALGGKMHQKVPASITDHLCGLKGLGSLYTPETTHEVSLARDGLLQGIFGIETLRVNSLHTQAVKEAGAGLRIEARAPDGVIEAVSCPAASFMLGLQWHPEYMPQHPHSQTVFRAFRQAVYQHMTARLAL